MKYVFRASPILVLAILLPIFGHAQDGVATGVKSLHDVLKAIYDKMMPQCAGLIDVGRAIAGFGAMLFISSRIWRHLAYAEPVDVYPLMRPFAIGLCIFFFPKLITVINSVMDPLSEATAKMESDTHKAVQDMMDAKIKQSLDYQMYVGPNGSGNQELWEQYSGDASDGPLSGISNAFMFTMEKLYFNAKNAIKQFLSDVLEVLFQAAALVINTLRTFQLIILAMLGPIVFGLSVFDGFQHTIRGWLARYINTYLWLPVANIFGSVIANIQLQVLTHDAAFFSATNVGYLVFMIIGIVGYFTVPSVAGHIIDVGSHGALIKKVSDSFSQTASSTQARAGAGAENIRKSPGYIAQGYQQGGQSGGVMGKLGGAAGRVSHYMKNRLGGKDN